MGRFSGFLATIALCCALAQLLAGCGGSAKLSSAPAAGRPSPARLQQLLAAEFARLGIDPGKVAAQAPTGGDNAVFDLRVELSDTDGPDGMPPLIELSFTERLLGDYDQNGEVNIADLTPLGLHFAAPVSYADPQAHGGLSYWPAGEPDGGGAANWRLARIDGDANGELNIADLTPLALHWNQRLDGYQLFRRAPGETAFHLVENPANPLMPYTLPRPATGSDQPVRYRYTDSPDAAGLYEYLVSAYDGLSQSSGAASGTVAVHTEPVVINEPPQAALSADPASGQAPLDVELDASASTDGDGTVTVYEWDWEGDGIYDFESGGDAAVQHTYAQAGSFMPAVRVTDDGGAQDTASCGLSVSAQPGNLPPQASLTATPDSGLAPLDVELDASASSDSDGTVTVYEWDWEGDGIYDFESGGDASVLHTYTQAGGFTPAVRVTDDGGAQDTASCGLSVAGDPGNLPPVASLDAEPNSGLAPLDVSFDASASYDPDGTLVSYEWDFDGDAVVDLTTEQPYAQHTYSERGHFPATVTVYDSGAAKAPSDAGGGASDSGGDPVDVLGWELFPTEQRFPAGYGLDAELIAGQPALSYFPLAPFHYSYIRAADSGGSSWGTPADIDTDGSSDYCGPTALLEVGGRPALFYTQFNAGGLLELAYVRASDAVGASWPDSAVSIATLTDHWAEVDCLLADGNPAVVFSDNYGKALYYCRAADALGQNWGAPLTVYSGDNLYTHVSAALIDGTPAACWVSGSDELGWPDYELRYARALDAGGASWLAPLIVDHEGFGPTLLNAGGAPAIAYQRDTDPGDFFDAALAYIRALNANGSSWPSEPQIVDASGTDNGWSVGAAVIGGVPAIGYADHEGRHYMYVEAADAAGGSWLTPQEVDSLRQVGSSWVKPLDIGGQPGLAYVSYADGRFEYLYWAWRH